jgi:hypothetical protein
MFQFPIMKPAGRISIWITDLEQSRFLAAHAYYGFDPWHKVNSPRDLCDSFKFIQAIEPTGQVFTVISCKSNPADLLPAYFPFSKAQKYGGRFHNFPFMPTIGRFVDNTALFIDNDAIDTYRAGINTDKKAPYIPSVSIRFCSHRCFSE